MERTSRRDARARVVGVLAGVGAVSRAALARRAALAPSTVSAVVSELHAAGLVVEPAEPVHPAERGTVGRPPLLVPLPPPGGGGAGGDLCEGPPPGPVPRLSPPPPPPPPPAPGARPPP